MNERRKLTGYLINPNYQGKFLIVFGAIGTLQTIVFFYAILQIFGKMELLVEEGLSSEELMSEVLQVQSSFIFLFGGLFILLSLLFIVLGFRFTHKTAGAVYHMQQTFETIEKTGTVQEMKLRDGDFFQDAGKSFNSMIKKFK